MNTNTSTIKSYQSSIINLIEKFVKVHPRALIIRVDLRFPSSTFEFYDSFDSPTEFFDSDSSAITRFIRSLRSQIEHEKIKKSRNSIGVHHTEVGYAWVREHNRSLFHHYHLLLFFNADRYFNLGSYDSRSSLAGIIRKAWCRAINVSEDIHWELANFPENPCYRVNRKTQRNVLSDLERRIEYMTKERTKIKGHKIRNFGRSQF